MNDWLIQLDDSFLNIVSLFMINKTTEYNILMNMMSLHVLLDGILNITQSSNLSEY